MDEINREMLLGYLMNALEDDEMSRVERELLRNPKLRADLAGLQQELSPLSYVFETVDPPPNLARRTCDKIWDHVDREEKFGHSLEAATRIGPVISLSIPRVNFVDRKTDEEAISMPNRSQVVEELVATSPHLQEEPPKRLVRHTEKRGRFSRVTGQIKSTEKSRSGKRGRWIDIMVAVSVGLLIAVLAFPVVNSAKNQVQTHYTQNKLREINQNIDLYTQTQGHAAQAMAAETSPQAGLPSLGWQEIKPDNIPLLVVNNVAGETVDPQLDTLHTDADSPIAADSRGGIILGQSAQDVMFGPTQSISLSDTVDLSGHGIFSNVGQLMPVSNSPMLQTTYGQNVIFHNGKIFVRRLPTTTPAE